MPGWLESFIAKILGSEPLVKVMYSIVVFVLIVVFVPDDYKLTIKNKTEVPGLWILFFYAIAFIFTDLAQRLLAKLLQGAKFLISVSTDVYLIRREEEKTNLALRQLNNNEREVLRSFINAQSQHAYLVPGDLAVISLRKKGLIIQNNKRSILNDDRHVTYEFYIPDKLYATISAAAEAGRLNPR